MTALVVFLVALTLLGGGSAAFIYWVQADGGSLFGPQIGVIDITGVITSSEDVIHDLIRFRKNEAIKAVVLRIDSPGGGVTASQEIYREVMRTREMKPVVASMGDVAASGGLYIASAASRIVANPSSVTGSIGVIMQLLNVQELIEKIGFQPVIIKSGPFKDIGSMTRPMADDERAILQGIVNQLYEQFLEDLAKARGMKVADIRPLADGRIFTGLEASKNGLVDELGGFEDAVARAKAMAGVEGMARLVRSRKNESWWQKLFGERSTLGGLWSGWGSRPVSFQFLYLPGLN